MEVAGRVPVEGSELAICVPATQLPTGGGVDHRCMKVLGSSLTDTTVATLGLGGGCREYEQQEYGEHGRYSWDDQVTSCRPGKKCS